MLKNLAYLSVQTENVDEDVLALGEQVADEQLVRVRIDDLAPAIRHPVAVGSDLNRGQLERTIDIYLEP
jgi:hypothetical protein